MGVYLGFSVVLPQVKHRWWWFNLQYFQSVGCIRSRFCDLPHHAVRAGQLRQLDPFQVVSNVAPGNLASVLNHTFQKQRQHRDGDMRVNAMDRPVKHRAHLESALHRPPGFFHALLLFVAQCHILHCQAVVVAVNNKLAVEAFKFEDGLPVDRQPLRGLLTANLF